MNPPLRRIRRRITESWYYIRCRLFHPYNVIRIRSLPPTWVDRDNVMLHANFQILVDFVEKEKPGEIIDWNSDDQHRAAWAEISRLYRWWTVERPARVDPLDKIQSLPSLDRLFGPERRDDDAEVAACRAVFDESNQTETAWHAEDQEMLRRLIELRDFLWT